MTSIRIDKWLWAARFFKTRSLASRACELGRVEANGQNVKPAREIRVGDLLRVKNDSGEFQIEVLLLSEMRGPAPVAQTLYRETEASRELRLKLRRRAEGHAALRDSDRRPAVQARSPPNQSPSGPALTGYNRCPEIPTCSNTGLRPLPYLPRLPEPLSRSQNIAIASA